MRLTDLSVSKLPAPEKGQRTYFDDLIPGFGIRVTSRGTRSWVVVYSSKRLLKTIGRYPDKSLKMARQDAKAFQVAQTPNPSRVTVSEAVLAFLEHSERHNRPRTTADYKRLLNRHLPTGKLRDITKKGLLEKLNRLAETPAEQSHAITAIKVFLNWCASAGHIEHNPIAAVRGVGRIKQRDRILTQKELKAVLKHALAYPYPFGAITTLLICTGQRIGEVGKLHRSYIGKDTITLPKELTKNKREHTFPFGTFTASILATVPDGEILFPGREDGYFRGYSKSKKDFMEGLDVAPFTNHDLRRTFASTHAELGTPVHIIERMLNHVSGTFAGVTGTYNRYSYAAEMREACTAYEAYIEQIIR